MSIEAMRWAWTQQVKATHKLVLMAIADGADSFGEARLSQGFLAYQTELSTRSVRTALSDLEAGGLLQRLRSSRKNGQRGVDQIVLSLDKGAGKAPWKGLGEVRRQLAERLDRDGLPAGEDFGPDLVAVSNDQGEDIVPSQSHRKNLPVVDRKPVDNDETPSQSHRKILPVVTHANTHLLRARTSFIHHHHPSARQRLWTTMTTRRRPIITSLALRLRCRGSTAG